jgi:3-hydroxymyristoyl/3-hydroxydecanoyl-(acyl carrier protein) dehydratase
MSDESCNLTDFLQAHQQSYNKIAFHDGRYYCTDAFHASIADWVARLQTQPFQRYALYTEDAYPFAVLLFALFYAGKEVWLAGNNRPGTAQQLQESGCQLIGDWEISQVFDYQLKSPGVSTATLGAFDPAEAKLIIFTSGSTGQPKAIEKRLSQLQTEIAALEQQWGTLLANTEVLSTVSHQHIYGLLFRVLWPLSAGRCFHSHTYLNPELLVNSINNHFAYWVASPAHLKRLDQNSPWNGIAELQAIFSSGGALPDSAIQQINQQCSQHIIEIYGSSETGGIAWKMQNKAWSLFPGMSLTEANGSWHLLSPYLTDNNPYPLDDQITLLGDGRFMLNGRADRIVKIEEKRLSLTELEQRLAAYPWITEAHVLMISQKRDLVCAVIVLTELGKQQLFEQGRNPVIRQLRNQLETWFESVVLPRKWLITNEMPLTTQGKIDHTLLSSLLDSDKQKLPLVLNLDIVDSAVQLGLKVPQEHELIYFPDHFAGFPILPGVIQLAWVEHFGKLFFSIGDKKKPFSHLEVVKFIKIIQPSDELTLTLKWKAATGELQFSFSSDSEGYSSGRMVYKSSKE